MKALWKRAAMALVSMIVLAAFSGSALAAGSSVTYDGNADQFVFLPGADLFQSFKGAMPGDTLTQEITVKNDTPGKFKVRIYLRAEPVEEKYKSFLSQMTLKVTQVGKSVLFEAPADQQGGLSSDVCLGTFGPGADIRLNVSLAVPPGMGNEFQDQTGLIRWVFTAEEIPDEDIPDTDDPADVWKYAALCGAGAAGLLTVGLIYRRRAAKKRADRRADM